MNEDEQKQLLQKKIFDNPSLYISTHVAHVSFRLSAKYAISISSFNWRIITLAFILNRNKESLKYCKETLMPILHQSRDFRYIYNINKVWAYLDTKKEKIFKAMLYWCLIRMNKTKIELNRWWGLYWSFSDNL